MLAKLNRLNKPQFAWLHRKGKKFGGSHFFIRYHKNNKPFSRFSVVVGIKIFKKAVQRNRMRRRIYEIIRLNLNELPIPYDIAIIARSIASKLKFEDMKRIILQSLKNIHQTNLRLGRTKKLTPAMAEQPRK